MRVKLKYTLPILQMVLALTLLRLSYLSETRAKCDMCGPGPAFDLLISINVPAALARDLLWRSAYDGFGPLVGFLLDDATLVAAVGLLWFWMALNFGAWRDRRTFFTFRWLPLRLAQDVLLIAASAFWGICCADEFSGGAILHWAPIAKRPGPPTLLTLIISANHSTWELLPMSPWQFWSRWLWFMVIAGLHVAWLLVLIFLGGHDFLYGFVRKNPQETQPR